MTTTQTPSAAASLHHEFDNENSTNLSVGGSSQNSTSSSASSISLSPVNFYKDVYGVGAPQQGAPPKNNETLDKNNNCTKAIEEATSPQKESASTIPAGDNNSVPKIYAQFQNEVSIH